MLLQAQQTELEIGLQLSKAQIKADFGKTVDGVPTGYTLNIISPKIGASANITKHFRLRSSLSYVSYSIDVDLSWEAFLMYNPTEFSGEYKRSFIRWNMFMVEYRNKLTSNIQYYAGGGLNTSYNFLNSSVFHVVTPTQFNANFDLGIIKKINKNYALKVGMGYLTESIKGNISWPALGVDMISIDLSLVRSFGSPNSNAEQTKFKT